MLEWFSEKDGTVGFSATKIEKNNKKRYLPNGKELRKVKKGEYPIK